MDRCKRKACEKVTGVMVGDTNFNVLIYADNSALVAENAIDLQVMLNKLNEACESMSLKINADKTKVMIFGMNEGMEEQKFAIRDAKLEKVNEFVHLGRLFTSDGRNSSSLGAYPLTS